MSGPFKKDPIVVVYGNGVVGRFGNITPHKPYEISIAGAFKVFHDDSRSVRIVDHLSACQTFLGYLSEYEKILAKEKEVNLIKTTAFKAGMTMENPRIESSGRFYALQNLTYHGNASAYSATSMENKSKPEVVVFTESKDGTFKTADGKTLMTDYKQVVEGWVAVCIDEKDTIFAYPELFASENDLNLYTGKNNIKVVKTVKI